MGLKNYMNIPEPLLPGWYTTGQIQEMLGEKTRQNVHLIAKRAKWVTKEIGKGQSKLHRAEDVIAYITKRYVAQRKKLAEVIGIELISLKSPDELPLTDRFDIECPTCKGFAIKYPQKGWACIKGHTSKG